MTDKPTLDQALAAWARHDPLTGAGDRAALDRILQHADAISAPTRPAPRPWWMLGGAMAASVAVALLLVGKPSPNTAPAPAGPAPVQLAAADPTDEAAFALLHTPLTEEEILL